MQTMHGTELSCMQPIHSGMQHYGDDGACTAIMGCSQIGQQSVHDGK